MLRPISGFDVSGCWGRSWEAVFGLAAETLIFEMSQTSSAGERQRLSPALKVPIVGTYGTVTVALSPVALMRTSRRRPSRRCRRPSRWAGSGIGLMKGPAVMPLTMVADGQVGEAAGSVPDVGRVDDDGRGEGAGVGLGLGHARARLDIGVEREGDGRQDADDGDHDHQLDEREALLVPHASCGRS